MITKEMLQQSAMFKMLAKQGKTLKGVLTKEDIIGKATVSVISCDIHDDGYPSYYFYTDDYCMGLGVIDNKDRIVKHHWGSSSIDNRDGDVDKFFRNCQLIETMDDLLKILNDDLI